MTIIARERCRRLSGVEIGVKRNGAGRRIVLACLLWVPLPLMLSACTTPAQLLLAAIPDGTLSTLLSHFEREPSANRQRIAELEQRGDWVELAKFAEQNLEKDRSNAAWWMVAGYAYSQQKQHARAIQCYREMVRLEPDRADGWNLLAQEHRVIGEPQRAIAVVNNALLVLRDSPATLLILGEANSDLKRHEPAVRAYRQALDLDGGLAPAWMGLARSYVKLGRPAEAEAIARSLEKKNPPLAAAIRQEMLSAKPPARP
jgi:tetratricopeptide (TPR) repeat protein